MIDRYVPGNRWDLLAGVVPDHPPTVSVVIVHYQQQGELDRTLHALHRQDHPRELTEIIVVDDGSAVAPTVPDHVHLIRQEDLGFRAAAARNRGAAAATGSVLCFLDADTAPEPGYLGALTRLPALSREAVTVGRRLHADLAAADRAAAGSAGTSGTSATAVETTGPRYQLPDPAWLRDGYTATADLLEADDRSYRFVISAVMACSRWFFEQVGGFDESFDRYGGEDWEWAYRAWLNGALLAHVREAIAWHDGPDWAGRALSDPERNAQQNHESLRLAALIPVVGSRGRGLHWARPDVVITMESAPSAAAALVCVDSLLAAVPDAVVLVPDEVVEHLPDDPRVVPVSRRTELASRLGHARLDVRVPVAVRVGAASLNGWIERVLQDRLGVVTLVDDAGKCLLEIRSRRAMARSARWPQEVPFPVVEDRDHDLRVLPREPGLAAYFGNW